MQSDRYLPDYGTLTTCIWCGAQLGQSVMPNDSASLFCSHRCKIEANYWLYQEMCVIEITHPQQSFEDNPDSP
jgi:endogenous inhibitor of DNA gyrase (YacG/DUF329 family)